MNNLYNIIIIITLAFFSKVNHAHEHHYLGDIGVSDDDGSIDAILWAHIIFMFIAFALIFPTGMVLGLGKSRWHVSVQLSGTIVATIGYFLGHSHGGKEFSENNIHSSFASVVVFLFLVQIGFGVYLKTHNRFVRPIIQKVHSIVGVTFPIIGYIQIVFGAITLVDWCKDSHLGQCLAHFIMGSSFMAYGIIIIILLRLGGKWLQKNRKSPEFYDNFIIMIWGVVNTWTEHKWNEPWTHKDLQHTALGILWWAGGMLGLYLARNGKRNIFPAIIIIFTGFTMASHEQSLETSTKIHAIFGFTLMVAGLTRIFEICFFRNVHINKKLSDNPFLVLPSYLLILSGLLFMGANEEQIFLLVSLNIDPYSYTLILVSISFLLFFFVNLLIDLYVKLVNYNNKSDGISGSNDSNGKGEYQELNESEISPLSSHHILPISVDDDDYLRVKGDNGKY